MNLAYGEIVALPSPATGGLGKARVGGALKEISLELLASPQTGDKVLLCEGIALAKVDPEEQDHVPGHTR